MTSEPSVSVVGFFDVVILVVAAPIMLLIGVPAGGYAIGAGVWIAVRAAGIAVDRFAAASDARRQIGIRMGYMLGRLFALAIAVIIARNSGGRDAGITCLAVIVFAYTVGMVTSAVTRVARPR
jgi:hypothetical protein